MTNKRRLPDASRLASRCESKPVRSRASQGILFFRSVRLFIASSIVAR
jgi:hypothetical protein